MSELLPLENALQRRRRRAPAESADWLRKCIRDDRGRVIPNLANTLVALRSAAELLDAIGFDEMQQAPVLLKELPIAQAGRAPRESIYPGSSATRMSANCRNGCSTAGFRRLAVSKCTKLSTAC